MFWQSLGFAISEPGNHLKFGSPAFLNLISQVLGIDTDLADVATAVGGNSTILGHGTYGLSALYSILTGDAGLDIIKGALTSGTFGLEVISTKIGDTWLKDFLKSGNILIEIMDALSALVEGDDP
jgi:hypothetical protein